VNSGKVVLFNSLAACNFSCKSPSNCKTVADYRDLKPLLTGGKHFCLVKQASLKYSTSDKKLVFLMNDVCNSYCQPMKQSLCTRKKICRSGNNCSNSNKVEAWLC
jgi:hypothetical protein